MAQTDLKSYRHQAPPLWRDIRVLQMAGQFVFALIVLAVAWQLVNNVLDALKVLGQRPDFRFWLDDNFFQQPSRWAFNEGPGLTSTDTFGRAFLVGIINSLRAVVLGIIVATILGIIIGVSRLSTNFLVRNIASAYVELFQNTPLLVQLIFLYRGVFLTLPQLQDAVVFPSANFQDALFRLAVYASATVIGMGAIGHLRGLLRARRGGEGPNPALARHVVVIVIVIGVCAAVLFVAPTDMIYLSSRGLVIPAFTPTNSFPIWLGSLLLGLMTGAVLWYVRTGRERLTGLPSHPWSYAIGVFIAIGAMGWIVAGAAPLSMDIPAPQIATLSDGREVVRRIDGGETISPEYAALVVGLILYTAAFIGEIVRAGIQAVSYGQLEAAYALGLGKGETLRRIILPQALRVIIPPLGNQYLNLTKNSSLATAIGFMDVFAVSKTIIHQAGEGVVMIMSVMLTYLAASLSISLMMNWLNSRMRLKER